MQFWKYQGAGNDFILIDQRRQQLLTRKDTHRIAGLCDRHFGVGADGLILLQTSPGFDFEMIYFNSDGRESTMCGNGGRCIAAFAKHLGMAGERYRFLAIDGEHEALLPHSIGPGGEWVELKMTDVVQIEALPSGDNENSGNGNAQITDYVLNTGSPHFVRFVSAPERLNVVEQGRAIRNSARFQAAGINVNFVRAADGQLAIRTYERGVEDETLACGTGVTAAALAWFKHSGMPFGPIQVPVQAQGGKLEVRFTAFENGAFKDIWLCGPAQRVFQGTL